MRIAQIAPVTERIPPEHYGGTERVISTLTEELVKRGHDVTLFASGDSKTTATRISISKHAIQPREAHEEKNKVYDIYAHTAWNVMNLDVAYSMQDQFDIIHDHTAQNFPMSLSLAERATIPVVVTLHGAFTTSTIALYSYFQKPHYVTISHSQGKLAPTIPYVGNVYHGLHMESYPFVKKPDDYLLYIGRISPEKGVHHAIRVAQKLNLPLIIAGGIDNNYKNYVKNSILPYLNNNIRWIGEVTEEKRNKLMSKAYCTLHPVTWPEPFGLTMIEAMACGSPVIGFNNGSIPEIIKHGTTGYVVDSVSEMMQAVTMIKKIKREDCRRYVLERFTVEKMTNGYEKIYTQILSKEKKYVAFPQEATIKKTEEEFLFDPDF